MLEPKPTGPPTEDSGTSHLGHWGYNQATDAWELTEMGLDYAVALAHEEKPTDFPAFEYGGTHSPGGWWYAKWTVPRLGGGKPTCEWIPAKSATSDPAVAAGLRAEMYESGRAEVILKLRHNNDIAHHRGDGPYHCVVCGEFWNGCFGKTEEEATARIYLEWHRSRQAVPQGTEKEESLD